MAAIRSKLDSRSAEFQANAREMSAKVADLRAVVAVSCARVPKFTVIIGGSFGAGN